MIPTNYWGMSLVNDGVCGLCTSVGQDVQHTTATFPRILRVLDLNLQDSLTEHRHRIGLCNSCETKLRYLEEASTVKANLKDVFVRNLKKLTEASDTDNCSQKADDESTHSIEQDHSNKRKRPMFDRSYNPRRKQQKTAINHTLPFSPAGAYEFASSDEENVLHIDETTSQCSPASSYTSSRATPSPLPNNSINQVLAELALSKNNRRKQARPAKATSQSAIPVKQEQASSRRASPALKRTPTSHIMHATPTTIPPQLSYAHSMTTRLPGLAITNPSVFFGQYQTEKSLIGMSLPRGDPTNLAINGLPSEVSDLAKNFAAESHTLLKTDKRRYCKVCAGCNRKANNGRPPQSRFLCSVCTIPMCRSCIEEHRQQVRQKMEEPSYSSTASARLLEAVKLKDETSTTDPLSDSHASSSSLLNSSIASSLDHTHDFPILSSKPIQHTNGSLNLTLPKKLPTLAPAPFASKLSPKYFAEKANLSGQNTPTKPFLVQPKSHKSAKTSAPSSPVTTQQSEGLGAGIIQEMSNTDYLQSYTDSMNKDKPFTGTASFTNSMFLPNVTDIPREAHSDSISANSLRPPVVAQQLSV